MSTFAPDILAPATRAEVGAQFFKALADPVRLAIIHELSQGERSVGDLVRNLNMGQADSPGERHPHG